MAMLRVALETPVVSQEALQVSNRLIRANQGSEMSRGAGAESENEPLFG
jgi:hypothetical protein